VRLWTAVGVCTRTGGRASVGTEQRASSAPHRPAWPPHDTATAHTQTPHRYGEREARWVADERWNFTLVWGSARHEALANSTHVLLALHGIDTVASVVLNGRHVLEAHNAHRCVRVVFFGGEGEGRGGWRAARPAV
jgi:hypothetical protein